MARPSSFQLLLVLYLTLLAATKMSRGYRPRLTAPRCHSLFKNSISCARMGLEEVPQDLFPGVEELDLSSNVISSISNSSFRPYHCIKNLSLFDNKITTIATGSFYAMRELQFLDLGHNYNGTIKITSELFKFSTNLSHLSFRSTPLEFFPNDTLKCLTSLKELDLLYTELPYINISSCTSQAHTLNISLDTRYNTAITNNTFIINCELNCLYLEASIDSIDSNAVASLRSKTLFFFNLTWPKSLNLWEPLFVGIANSEIQKLFLTTTRLNQINQHGFAPLWEKPLQVLDLYNNKITNLDGMGFLSLPLLNTLVLNNCSIRYINPTNFARMKGLEVLNLNHNDIEGIGGIDGVCNGTEWDVDLRELHLAYNELVSILRCFRGLTNLKILVLKGNAKLLNITIFDFDGLISLKSLDVSGCNLASLSISDVPNFETFVYSDCDRSTKIDIDIKSVKHVFLRNASMNSFWIPSLNGTVSLFRGMRNLTNLDIQKNPLKLLHSGLFVDLLILEKLDLSYCQLIKIEEKAFEGLQRLQTLYLQGNDLHDLPRGVLQNMGLLGTIHMADNALMHLEKDLFVNSSKLTNLTVAGNKLTGFNRSTFEPILNTLRFIDISDNDLVCTCDLKWLPTWLSGSITLMNENDTRCSTASLEELQERPLMMFHTAGLCGPNISLCYSLSLVITCIVVIVIFAYRHRWFLNYKLFLLKMAVIGYREIQDARDIDDFEFHLNVMFAEDDEEWVRDHLRPVLEELLPDYHRNIYGDNDLPLGMHYCDAVHYVVEMSYKTIMLVSRAAIQDNWFVIKFRTAADQVNDTQLENVVVIFLEDIPDNELPFLVRLYLSDRKPYLSWNDDEEFQEYFWPKLTKMLTMNLRCNNVIPPE